MRLYVQGDTETPQQVTFVAAAVDAQCNTDAGRNYCAVPLRRPT